MQNKFFDFFLILNSFTGTRRKEHNSFLSYSTLFDFNGYSIINYKMMKIQFRTILLLLYNLLLRKADVTVTNYDKDFENLSFLPEFVFNNTARVAEEWISPVLSNRPGIFLSKDFIIQQSFSALLHSYLVFNLGNVKHGDLNRSLIRRRSLLVSTLNTNAKIFDNQYYLTVNTQSYSMLFFLAKFFGHILLKVALTDSCLSYNNILRYRYWYGMRHVFSMRYIRRSIFLRGLLARGLLNICLQKLTKSYRRIVLYNVYCTEFFADLKFNSEINLASTRFLAKMHDHRLVLNQLRRRAKLYRIRRSKKRYKSRYRGRNKRKVARFFKSRFTQLYHFDLFRSRLKLKRLISITLSKRVAGLLAPDKAYRIFLNTKRVFLHTTPFRFRIIRIMDLLQRVELAFFAKKSKKSFLAPFFRFFLFMRETRKLKHSRLETYREMLHGRAYYYGNKLFFRRRRKRRFKNRRRYGIDDPFCFHRHFLYQSTRFAKRYYYLQTRDPWGLVPNMEKWDVRNYY